MLPHISVAMALAFAGVAGPPAPLDSTLPVSLALEEVPVQMVLQMLAQQNDLNIVVTGDLEGDVTLRLDSVDVTTALDAILTPRGYNYYITENVIVVKSREIDTPQELVSHVVTLQFADPVTVSKALLARKSAKGSIVILDKQSDGRAEQARYQPNRLLISDVPESMREMLILISEIDIPERQISIEVKIIESTRDNRTHLGFLWPSTIEATLGRSSDTGTTSSTILSGTGAGSLDLNSGDWTWGTLTVGELRTVLDLLERSGNSKLLSDPHITTLENHEAEIKVQTVIPIATINRFTEGAAVQDVVTFQDEEVGISLTVTPRITGDGRIRLDVTPTVEDIIGFTGPPENQKPITTSRSVSTRITVADGETAALGGLLDENEIIQEQRVPLLGHLPLIGRLLFTNKSTEKTTTDLIVLITPRIVP